MCGPAAPSCIFGNARALRLQSPATPLLAGGGNGGESSCAANHRLRFARQSLSPSPRARVGPVSSICPGGITTMQAHWTPAVRPQRLKGRACRNRTEQEHEQKEEETPNALFVISDSGPPHDTHPAQKKKVLLCLLVPAARRRSLPRRTMLQFPRTQQCPSDAALGSVLDIR